MSKKNVELFEKYSELQNLLLSMDDEPKINEVKNFIDDNNLWKNKNKTLSTIRLIASIVLVKPNLLDNAVKLLNLYDSIDMYSYNDFFSLDRTADKEVIYRTQVILLLFILSKHGSLIKEGKYGYYDSVFLKPVEFCKIDMYISFYDSQDIKKLSDEDKIKKRNQLHSINQISDLIRKDDLDGLQSFISKNNYDISLQIPRSLFEMHDILNNATPLEISAFYGSINCFKFLLNMSVKINYKRLLASSYAGGNYEIIHITENQCQDEEIKKNIDCLHQSILYFHDDLIDYYVQNYSVKIDSESYIKCIYASNYGAFLKLLQLDNSLAINEFGLIGSTPIDIASFEGFLDFFKFLMSIEKVDPKKHNSFGKTVLQSAARSGKLYIVKYIIKHSLVDPNDKGEYGISAAQIARNYGWKKVFDFLKPISNPADLEEEEEEESGDD